MSRIAAGVLSAVGTIGGGLIGAAIGAESGRGRAIVGPASRKEATRAQVGAVIGAVIGAVSGAALGAEPATSKPQTGVGQPAPLRFP